MNRILQHIVSIVMCYLLMMPAYAENTIQILSSHAGEPAELLSYLNKTFKGEAIIIADETVNEKADLLVVLNNDNPTLPTAHPPVLYVLPQPSTRELQKQDSALYWTPSLAAQLALIRVMLPATNRVGMLVSNNNEDIAWLRSFKQYAAEQSIEVRFQTVDKSRIARQVSELAAATDVLLAQPDTDIYNRETIRFILLAAYR